MVRHYNNFSLDSRNENLPEKRIHRNYALTTVSMPRASSGGIGAGGSPCARRAGAILPMILEHNGSLTWLRAERAEGCEMAKMSAGDLKALLSAERYDALSAMAASKLSDERASALNYYMGNMSKDMPAPDGRSKAVSSDVADTIEGLMPLMEIFAAGEEVVQFAPVGPEDVAAAEQETDYVNHVFMQQNPGFLARRRPLRLAVQRIHGTGIVQPLVTG